MIDCYCNFTYQICIKDAMTKLFLFIALDHVCMEDEDKHYMLLWPSTKVGNTHYITEPCVEGVANYILFLHCCYV